MKSQAQAKENSLMRVFFSFHIPQNIGECLLSHVPSTLPLTVYPSKNLHLTVKFIGDVDENELEILKRVAEKISASTPPITLSLKKFVVAEERLRIEVESHPALSRLFNKITDRLEESGIGIIQPKRYAPHITLGRPTGEFDASALSALHLDAGCSKLQADALELHRSEPGEDELGEYTLIQAFRLLGKEITPAQYTKIVLPARAQPDTLVAIFILKRFGESRFPGIKEAGIDFWQMLPPGETEETLDEKGILLIDLGGGRFDHHAKKPQTTASDLIAEYLGVKDDPSLAKLLEYARRDDFFGKGTVSEDPIDRAFGLSALVAALNKSLVKDPGRVVEIVTPILVAHHNEEVRRVEELPKEFEEKLKKGEAETFSVKQRDKKLKVVMITSESGSMAGYLRSKSGGAFDVVAQWLPSGHVNILTRPTKRVDLRSLAALIRAEEMARAGRMHNLAVYELARFARIREVPEWYYDPATNSIQNGGLNPKEVSPTKIPKEEFKKILELGLSEKLWDPRTRI